MAAGAPPLPHPAEVPVTPRTAPGSAGREPPAATVDDLAAEQRAAAGTRRARSTPDAWLQPTPARGWDVRDTIAHLADTDEMAIDDDHRRCRDAQRAERHRRACCFG